ncbi:adenosylcobinamide-GDP ribazoletransferase [Alicyclobacillus macrosporangiidus]|uniref:Adenosylcobinamide-GDP ribazoletransferase n=1 Tax=Alicyclobacillus macrosporangiidus TaxID=392015 RepID=A0A1I7JKD9_9BACL|nr:adenosylcobinamide-GDP ribazoletransferase [Alicyclobacillus macrosporangiidus]SFU85646.1 adenosylcobinamide-phosphate synthase/adenosylcobinamide-GDP ribazoletransferase [Alicyclobacillus macrosporangiidus]
MRMSIQASAVRTVRAGGRAFLLAFRFLTILPIPTAGSQALTEPSPADLRRSALFFPLAGAVLGWGVWAVSRGLAEVVSPLGAAVVAVTGYTVATGALHLDGLMDVADAVASRRRGAEAIAVMKDSRVGAAGAVAGMLALAGKIAAITALAGGSAGWGPFVLVPALARLGMVWAMAGAGPAGSSGLGAVFARRVPAWVVAGATACALGASAAAMAWGGPWAVGGHGSGLWTAAGLWAAAVIAVRVYTAWAARRFGGMTGDLYGGLNEGMEWLGWLWVSHG